ncbi:MAG: hypothetical protein ABF990_01805 [Acetobacter sp.]|uniref:hypothetical protein n=1 Tax=Acetobacter sp. TaxID=440 RepID=UPI0039ED5FE5
MAGTNPFGKDWAEGVGQKVHRDKRVESDAEKVIGGYIGNRDARHKFIIYCTKHNCFGDGLFVLMVQQYRTSFPSVRLRQAQLITTWCIEPAIDALAYSIPADNATPGSWEAYATGASGTQSQLDLISNAVRNHGGRQLSVELFDSVHRAACEVIFKDQNREMQAENIGKKKWRPDILGNIRGSIRSVITLGDQMPSAMSRLIKEKKRDLSAAGFAPESMGFY